MSDVVMSDLLYSQMNHY